MPHRAISFRVVKLPDCSFAVVDCETTGFHPSAHHRIVELAIVQVSGDGRVGETWCTLLRPERDLGPTEVHGLRGRDLMDAPAFAEVMGHVIERLAGRVVVAHNAMFDTTFLHAELARAGAAVPSLPALCTLRLAHQLGVAGGRGRLADCCAAAGIDLGAAHTAEADALACAALFAQWLPQMSDDLSTYGCEAPLPHDTWPQVGGRSAAVRRRGGPPVPREPDFLASLVQEMNAPRGIDAAEAAAYVELLDRALEDRRLSRSEQHDLAEMAALLGLTAQRVRELHGDYLATLVALALRDRVVTDRERADLELVAEALGVAELKAMLAACEGGKDADDGAGLTGKTVCFTGALLCRYEGEVVSRELAEQLALAAGLVVAPRVTKKVDLLVVADPHTMSSKARKAQEYGTRIVAETAFWPMLGLDIA
jgi:DNA polymerase-3 subunit epsilon